MASSKVFVALNHVPIHRALSDAYIEVRLVRFIAQDLLSSGLNLELRHVPFEGARYDAISYVWGNSENSVEIHVNGIPFFIRRNLFLALQQLYRHGIGTTSWLWVDGICIKQTDDVEKGSQVNLMGSIFSNADRVYLWLGPSNSSMDHAMDFIARIGPRALATGVMDLSYDGWKCSYDFGAYAKRRLLPQTDGISEEFEVPEVARCIFDIGKEPGLRWEKYCKNDLHSGMQELLLLPYWCRIWIIQEAALAKQGIVLCGTKKVSLDEFDAAYCAVSICNAYHLPEIFANDSRRAKNYTSNLYDGLVPLVVRRQCMRCDTVRLLDILLPAGVAGKRPIYSASDPRDIAFGLLGVVGGEYDLGIRADYTMTVTQVFTMMTRMFIENPSNGTMWYNIDNCVPRSENVFGLPSWVPNWQEIGLHGTRIRAINDGLQFTAGLGIGALAPGGDVVGGALERLSRVGCLVDIVDEVMERIDRSGVNEFIDDIEGKYLWLHRVYEFTGIEHSSGPGEDYIWRTIMTEFCGLRNGDNLAIIRRIFRREDVQAKSLTKAEAEFINHGVFNFDGNTERETLEDRLNAFKTYFCVALCMKSTGRTLFKTAKNMFGLGHSAIRTGDMVTLLDGVGSPIILRARSEGDSGGYTFVGDAYVDGIMHGEFLATNPTFQMFDMY